jgi:hypothetical protein
MLPAPRSFGRSRVASLPQNPKKRWPASSSSIASPPKTKTKTKTPKNRWGAASWSAVSTASLVVPVAAAPPYPPKTNKKNHEQTKSAGICFARLTKSKKQKVEK